MASRTEKMQDVLRTLRGTSPDIIGAAVVSIDGFIVASVLPSEIDEELVSGMAAAMLGVAEKISTELMTSSMEQVYVRSEKGYVVINAVGSESVLVVLTTKEAKLGLVFIEVKRRCADLAKVAQAAA
ncbi:MAG: roadblock/LC7 domain-containing protein [Polyangiaceae bacterium]|jgi:predicted regulator of Ras-like GTPase activity (Roadblock/LC7/MglB family)